MTKTINVTSAFDVIIARPPGGNVLVRVPQGVSNQDDDVAEHWYTQIHLASGGLGSPDYATTVRAQADAAFVKARDAFAGYKGLEAAAQEAEAAAGVEMAPASDRLSLGADASAAEPDDSKPKRGRVAKATAGDTDVGADSQGGASEPAAGSATDSDPNHVLVAEGAPAPDAGAPNA